VRVSRTTASCPTCKRDAVSRRDGNKFFPFCSERCQLVDLGRWLDEEYRVPAEPVDPSTLPTTDDGSTKDDKS